MYRTDSAYLQFYALKLLLMHNFSLFQAIWEVMLYPVMDTIHSRRFLVFIISPGLFLESVESSGYHWLGCEFFPNAEKKN